MADKIISVYALNRYLKSKIDQDYQLQDLHVEGEVSNYRPHPSGHMYFTLKDEKANISVVMFFSYAKMLSFKLKNGMKIIVSGHLSVYEKNGTYQLYAHSIKETGLGDLYRQFALLKTKLEKEGLFDERHKKQIPSFPLRIAVLSAKQGAALQDTLKTIKQRYPVVRIVIFPIPVQGKDAYQEIISTLKLVDQLHFSTILLVRGGGSIEDLWNFNEEALVRAIYDLNTPIITGVGHETDLTLVDFVSDLRGATPTAAAMLATPDIHELADQLTQKEKRLSNKMKTILSIERNRLNRYTQSYVIKNPMRLYENKIMHLDHDKERLLIWGQQITKEHTQSLRHKKEHLDYLIKQSLSSTRQTYAQKLEKLELVSPLKTLARGYAIVRKDGHAVISEKTLKQGDQVELILSDGRKNAMIQ